MISRLPKLMLVVTLAASIGLHWTMLQSVAWVGMFITYSEQSTLKEALVKTFDGKHPCPLCKEIQQGKKSEKKSNCQIEIRKFDFLSDRQFFVFTAPNHFHLFPCLEVAAPSRSVSPPVPPPRPF